MKVSFLNRVVVKKISKKGLTSKCLKMQSCCEGEGKIGRGIYLTQQTLSSARCWDVTIQAQQGLC